MSRIALSLRQPWAWAVVHGGKTIENRRWGTRFRGEFLIHAAKGMTRVEYGEAIRWICYAAGRPVDDTIPRFEMLARGGIIGRARLVDVIEPCFPKDYDGGANCLCKGSPWHMGDQYGFVLADVVALPFEPLTGKLGFFDPDTKGWARPDFGDRR